MRGYKHERNDAPVLSYRPERPLRGWELVLRGYPRRELTGAHFQQRAAGCAGEGRFGQLGAARGCAGADHTDEWVGSLGRQVHSPVSSRGGRQRPGGSRSCRSRCSTEQRAKVEAEKQTPKNWVRKSGSRNRRRQGARRYNPTAETGKTTGTGLGNGTVATPGSPTPGRKTNSVITDPHLRQSPDVPATKGLAEDPCAVSERMKRNHRPTQSPVC